MNEEQFLKAKSKKKTQIVHPTNEKSVRLKRTLIIKPDIKKNKKQYLIQKRKEDGKWEVVIIGGNKAIKLFDTELEAREYATTTAKNQKGSIIKRASKGERKGKFVSL